MPSLPPDNPSAIQDSVYPAVHFNAAQTDATELAAWTEDSTLESSQITWLPSVAFIGTAHRPYADGEEALFFAGTSRVGKIRITDGDFTIIDEVYIPGYESASPQPRSDASSRRWRPPATTRAPTSKP